MPVLSYSGRTYNIRCLGAGSKLYTTVSPMGNRESEGAMSCELTRHRPLVSPECRVSSQDGFSRGNPIDRTEFAVDVDIFTTLLCFFDLVNLWHWQSFSFQLLHGIGQNFKIL